jgi:hypothetical protein
MREDDQMTLQEHRPVPPVRQPRVPTIERSEREHAQPPAGAVEPGARRAPTEPIRLPGPVRRPDRCSSRGPGVFPDCCGLRHRLVDRSGRHQGLRDRAGLRDRVRDDHGSATAEYAIVILAAVAFAGVLVAVMRSGEVQAILTDLVRGALTS